MYSWNFTTALVLPAYTHGQVNPNTKRNSHAHTRTHVNQKNGSHRPSCVVWSALYVEIRPFRASDSSIVLHICMDLFQPSLLFGWINWLLTICCLLHIAPSKILLRGQKFSRGEKPMLYTQQKCSAGSFLFPFVLMVHSDDAM